LTCIDMKQNKGMAGFDRVFKDNESCREYLKSRRWPDGPVCPHCSDSKGACRIKGKTARAGLYTCKSCRRQFTVTMGTILEGTRLQEEGPRVSDFG
jgi:hypothetical protein